MHIFARGTDTLDLAEDDLQLLGQNALDLQELVFVLRTEFLASGQAQVVIELLPALQVALHLQNQPRDLLGSHSPDGNWFYLRPSPWGARKMIAPPRSGRAVNLSAENSAV